LEKHANEDRETMTDMASTMLRDYAAESWPRMNHKGRLRELSRLLPWSDRRVRSVYNGEPSVSLRAAEMAEIERLTNEANRDDFQDLQARVARLEAALLSQDEEFHQPTLAAIRQGLDGGRRNHVASATDGADEI
jgi:hypothetical protein